MRRPLRCSPLCSDGRRRRIIKASAPLRLPPPTMTESTESTVAPSQPAQSSFWEDVIDIFYQPSAVFRRREHRSVWPPMLFVALSIGIIFFITFDTLEPAFGADIARAGAQAMAKNPQITQEILDKQRSVGEAVTRYGISVVMLVTMFILGLLTWLVGKLVGSKQTFQAALVVAAWSYVPRVLGAVIGGVQGLLMDPSKLNSAMSFSLSPARFMDPDTTNAGLLQLAARVDLITIWVTVLLAIGMYVTGKVSKQRAAVFGILIWIVGSLPALRQVYISM